MRGRMVTISYKIIRGKGCESTMTKVDEAIQLIRDFDEDEWAIFLPRFVDALIPSDIEDLKERLKGEVEMIWNLK